MHPCDFIRRTLNIIEQYDQFVVPSTPESEQLDVSLLINCLTGLLVLPFEHQKRIQGGELIPDICSEGSITIGNLSEEWGLSRVEITTFILKGQTIRQEDITLSQIVYMMRHSIAHSKFGDGNTKRKPDGISVGYSELIGPVSRGDEKLRSKIEKVNFVNHHLVTDTHFEATIPVEDLKIFAKKLAETVLDEMGCYSIQ